MYRILCFGDSNTWGFNPADGLRLSTRERWPGVLRDALGEGFEIFENGVNGRRILGSAEDFNSVIKINEPLDIVIIFLGINDLLFEKETRVEALFEGIRGMLADLRANSLEAGGVLPETVLMGAVPINDEIVRECMYELEAEKAKRFNAGLRKLAGAEGCGFIESGMIVQASEQDGVHLDAAEHKKLGLFLADYIRSFLSNGSLNSRKKIV